MRFLRWYYRLTRDVFIVKPSENFKEVLRNTKNRLLRMTLWFFISVFTVIVFCSISWLLSPESLRVAIWAIVSPIFNWIASLDWKGLDVFLVPLLIAIFVTILNFVVIISVADFFKTIVFSQEWKKESKAILVACLVLSVLGGYYATTSSYGVSAVNNFLTYSFPHIYPAPFPKTP